MASLSQSGKHGVLRETRQHQSLFHQLALLFVCAFSGVSSKNMVVKLSRGVQVMPTRLINQAKLKLRKETEQIYILVLNGATCCVTWKE